MPDYGSDLRFGAFLTPSLEEHDAVAARVQRAEDLGLDLVAFQDHPYQRRFAETWTLLSHLAARTTRIHLATSVLSVPLRLPAMVGKSAATLDALSGGRLELGLGAGFFWDGLERMGATRLTPGESVDALARAVDVVREAWSGPVGIGAYKPRMLRLTGRSADIWVPGLAYLDPQDFAAANAAIDAAATAAGRDPAAIARQLNLTPGDRLPGPPSQWAARLAGWAGEHGFSSFVLGTDDPGLLDTWAREVAPEVRERVAAARAGTPPAPPRGSGPAAPAPAEEQDDDGGEQQDPVFAQYRRVGVEPTVAAPVYAGWDEAARPHRAASPAGIAYTAQGRAAGQHLVDVHDRLRAELSELRDLVERVKDGRLDAGAARGALQAMALRQNDWTLGAFCSRYCRFVASHHELEDTSVFPHLRRAEPELGATLDRLDAEHLVIHGAIEAVDGALVDHIRHPERFERLDAALDALAGALLSHLSYEEVELVEPLARLGFG